MRRLLALLPLAACAQAPAAPDPAAWIGRTEGELVAALGVPNRVHEADGRRFLAYDTIRGGSSVVPSIGLGVGRSTGGWGSATGIGTGLGLSFGGYGTGGVCTTSFELIEGRVATGQRQGTGCS